MTTQTLIRLILGMSMTAVVGVFALRRVWWLYKLVMSGQPASGRTDNLGTRIWTQISEVLGQRRLLKWSIPGLAHFFTMWGFFILLTVYIEAYGLLFEERFHIPVIGRWDALGFLQDFFATAVFLGITTFAIIRILRNPREIGRSSRFYGSHNGGAWLVLLMIFNVIWTYVLVRGSAVNNGTLPYGNGAFLSQLFGAILRPLGQPANEIIETTALLLHIGVMLAFLILVLHSKHLHIFLAPINVTFKRLPDGLGPLLPLEADGKPIDFENPSEDAVFGRGKIEDFTWKGMLDFATCTECGRCQSQCPAWNTGKPLSPKLVIMDLRDHWMAKAPYILGQKGCQRGRRGRSPRASSRAGIGVRSSARAWTGAGDSPAGRHRGTGWRYRSRRLVVMCDLWCLRRAVPGGYRTCRSHRRYAPLPGDDGVGVPLRAVGAVQEPGDQGQPVGSERLRSHQLDRRG